MEGGHWLAHVASKKSRSTHATQSEKHELDQGNVSYERLSHNLAYSQSYHSFGEGTKNPSTGIVGGETGGRNDIRYISLLWEKFDKIKPPPT